MSVSFETSADLILVSVRLIGPTGETVAQFALDTGATETVVHSELLRSIGYDLSLVQEQVSVTTASGIEEVPRLRMQTVEALGQQRNDLEALALSFSHFSQVEGLLGLNFVRGQRLCIDYQSGQLTLE